MSIWDWLFDKPKEEKKYVNNFSKVEGSAVCDMTYKDEDAFEIKYLLLDKEFSVNVKKSDIERVLKGKISMQRLANDKCERLIQMCREEFKDKLEIRREIDYLYPLDTSRLTTPEEVKNSVLNRVREQLGYFTNINFSSTVLPETFVVNGVSFNKTGNLFHNVVYSANNVRHCLTNLNFKGRIVNNFTPEEISELKISFEKLLKNNRGHLFRQYFENLKNDKVLLEYAVNSRCKKDYKGYKIKIEEEEISDKEEITIKVLKEVGDGFYKDSHTRSTNKEEFVNKVRSWKPLDNLIYNTEKGINING